MTVVLPDTSVWARRGQPEVASLLADAIDAHAVATVQPVVIELLRSARSADDLVRLARLYGSLHLVPLNEDVASRARDVQAALARKGQHRGPSVTDLLTAAAAELAGVTIWHCDRHYEQIAAVTNQPSVRVGE